MDEAARREVVVDVASREEAVAMAERWPSLRHAGAAVEVWATGSTVDGTS
jgi:hypothetical protein